MNVYLFIIIKKKERQNPRFNSKNASLDVSMPLPSKLSLIIRTHASKKKKVLHSMSIIQYLNLIWERKTVIFFLLYIYIYKKKCNITACCNFLFPFCKEKHFTTQDADFDPSSSSYHRHLTSTMIPTKR
jgi:hypothetical protein